MMRSLRYFLFTVLLLLSFSIAAQRNMISFQDGFYHINNEKVFLKGIGYEAGAIPGQLPWERDLDEELLRFDMNRIEKAGFNTIRTWSAFTEEELNIISDFDLYILMGIWIDPHGDFSDPAFIENANNTVENVLSYSHAFDNIIGYIIMNEPLPETIFAAGYNNTVVLWEGMIDIIHDQHPGVPVTFANTCGGTFIEQDIFDFNAFNVYIYNPVTVNHTHKYTGFVQYLDNLHIDDSPLIITEFGLSVSPTGQGGYGYGGNTLEEQTDGILAMYRALIDGGAGGGCFFNYSDGWWKGGNEYSHDDHPEEWFGLIKYENLEDKYGTPRPCWDEIMKVNSAIICQPKNGMICANTIAIEIFADDTISSMTIIAKGELIYSIQITQQHFTDTLSINEVFDDYLLEFSFYNEDDLLISNENISIIVTNDQISLPVIDVSSSVDIWNSPQTAEVNIYLESNGDTFSNNGVLNYASYYHQGFEYGNAFVQNIPANFDNFSLNYTEYITESTPVITFSAGYGFYYGSFYKWIYDQEQLIYEGYLDLAELAHPQKTYNIDIYPNPADHAFRFLNYHNLQSATYILYNTSGSAILKGMVNSDPVNTTKLSDGMYLLLVYDQSGDRILGRKLIIF